MSMSSTALPTGPRTGEKALSARRALVTGGGAGIGAAIAGALRAAGAEVRTVDIDPAGDPFHVGDASDDRVVEELFARLDDDLGGLDIVVNNIGVAGPTGAVEELDPAEFDRCVRINLGATFRVTRMGVPRLRARGGGSIVNISSTAGHLPYPLRSPYAASKWAVEGLTRSWAMELGRFGIRVNCVAPGAVGGDRMDRVIAREAAAANADPADIRRAYRDQVSMRTFVTADDIAAAVVFFCSDAARFVNGQILSVDGHTETLRTAWPDDIRPDDIRPDDIRPDDIRPG